MGEKVEYPDALDTAVALLKDPSGKIDFDLPVSGDVGDPRFDIRAVTRASDSANVDEKGSAGFDTVAYTALPSPSPEFLRSHARRASRL